MLSDNPRGNDEDKKPVKQKVFVDNPVNEKVAKHPTTHTPSSTGSEPKKRNEPAAEELTRSVKTVDGNIARLATSKQRKRAIDNDFPSWQGDIPVVIDPAYSDPMGIKYLKVVFRWYSENTCLKFVDETSRYDPNNTNWFVQNGYRMNSYLKIVNLSGSCTAIGTGPGEGAVVKVSPCFGTYINQHEIGHGVGVSHTQQGIDQFQRIGIMVDSMQPSLVSTYLAGNPNILSPVTYDEQATMQYTQGTWSANGESTYECIDPDFCDADTVVSEDCSLIREINEKYTCNALFCKNDTTYCGLGYYAMKKGVCQCICPREYNSTTKCSTFIDQADKSVSWPNMPFSLIGAGDDWSCPTGFKSTGWLSFCGKSAAKQAPAPIQLPQFDKTLNLPICSKTTPTSKIDWDSWPMGGRMCVIKPQDVDCGGVFTEFAISYDSFCPVQKNGTIGDITVSGTNITMRFCCKGQDNDNYPISLPNDKPFQLFMVYSCPVVRGMRCYESQLSLYTPNVTSWGVPDHPQYWVFSREVQLFLCYCLPPTYGCSMNVTLSPTKRSVTIATPSYQGARIANKRCFFCFNVPQGAKIRITFNDYDLSTDDKFLVKKYHQCNEPHRLDNSNPPSQLVSEGSYMCLESWTGYQNVTNRGVNFTAELIMPEESCYDLTRRGQDYIGTENITRTNEVCLPWKDTVNCYDYPLNDWEAMAGYLEENYCRNPGGNGIEPWCYVYTNGTNCQKRYCDVCHFQQVSDKLPALVCAKEISANPNFCTTSVQKYACFKSCGLSQAPPVTTACPANFIPYKERCVFMSTTSATLKQAKDFCSSQGTNGNLFQVRNEDDQEFLARIKQETGVDSYTFISGQLKNGDWYFTDTNILMSYFNWTGSTSTNDIKSGCIILYKITSTTGRSFGWISTDCTSTSSTNSYVCQVDRMHGILVGANNSFYKLGDRAYVQCKYSTVVPDAPSVLFCKKTGWTTLKSACGVCPVGWMLRGNRCVFFSTDALTWSDAANFCRTGGRNGSLFRMLSDDDQSYFRTWRQTVGIDGDHTWISGQLISGNWFYSDSTTQMTYFNWTNSASTNSKTYACLYLYREVTTSGRNGGWSSSKCDSTSAYPFACQIDVYSTSDNSLSDASTSCQDTLTDNPNFCTDIRSASTAASFCYKSCGFTSGAAKCKSPSSKTYTLTSPNSTIYAGGSMTFACNSGYFYMDGDTSRACGVTGKLLGTELSCSNKPASVTVGYYLLKSRLDSTSSKTVFCLDYDGYRVPINGKIVTWFTYCEKAGDITFLIYRKSGSTYSLQGSYNITCQQGLIWSYDVPSASQTKVQVDDIVGAYTAVSGIISMTDCSGRPDQFLMASTATAATITEALGITSFTKQTCMAPAISYKVQK